MNEVELGLIIPVAARDLELMGDLSLHLQKLLEKDELEGKVEVIWSLPHSQKGHEKSLEGPWASLKNSRPVFADAGRAYQLNKGAEESLGRVLWFLHVDSKPVFTSQDLVNALRKIEDDKLYFFDFKFDYPARPLNRLTEFGVWLRSYVFGIPFGDQGFILTKKTFNLLEGYCENVMYGEDHLFVWSAKKTGVKTESLGLPLQTSSVKYQKNGWLATTLKHFYLTWRQALPQIFSVFFKKRRGF